AEDESDDSEDGEDDACGSTLPQANAGGDGTLKVEQSTTLDGSSSTGSSLTYAWSISSGSGSLTNQTTSSPTFTAPSLAGSSVVSLTVTDCNNNTSTDTTTLYYVASSANSQAADKEFVLVNDDSTVSETVQNSQVTLTVTYQGNSFKVRFSEAISENYNVLMTSEGTFVICLPQASDTQGVCYISSSSASSLSGTYDLDAALVSDFVRISGAQSGDRLGEYMGVNSDEDEIYLVAPGSGANGEARIYDLNANLIGIILGKDGLSICSVLFSNYLEVNAESVSLGPCNIAQNEGLAQINAAESSLSLMKGVLEETSLTAFVSSSSLDDGDGTFDLNDDDADAELNCTARSTAFGDVNGDGNDDYLICGTSLAYVFFGPYDDADSCDDADMVISSTISDDGFCSSVSLGDVTEDGVDDIVIGGTDKLYIIFGSTSPAASIVIETSPSAMTIEASDVGVDVQIVDSIIYSSNGRIYSLQTLQEEEADAGANSLSAAGCQLDISKNNRIINPAYLLLLLSSMPLVAVLRKRKEILSKVRVLRKPSRS
ncbi:MAG TPA: hypothetical protein DDW49_01575, partial [Deltaproteobacteria bacterium]|nr:hypothetical protein [Deltaproteobacteria bacterium]